jgi:hypothetical protein
MLLERKIYLTLLVNCILINILFIFVIDFKIKLP